ncbi:glycerate kinase [Flagellimonas meridianipacifica]|uniref:Glycerate kinase n=1 Tax=Flagellimonas meridianipacifica TaxID=1080225 RepID=A0A2T0MI71_9FLAO|nr:glycerate kinase [Allomuricauda pacifica]PRX57281.1 glycerate kinase [Allomuricauda pacifica]
MKFVLAPDKYKGSLSGEEFCDAVESGLLKVFPKAQVLKKPLADGGDGTLEVVKHYLNAEIVSTTVQDPLFREIKSDYLFSKDKGVAFIEMSEASGYKLLSKTELNCMNTTSLGTGDLIKDALEKGAREIVLGIGGSATNDGGIGMATALGYQFLDSDGNEIKPIGKNLSAISRIDGTNIHPKLQGVEFKVACDVKNPLHGKEGAAFVYGPQKGATPEDVIALDNGLQNFAKVVHKEFGIDVQNIQGAGAAGGMGAGAVVFLKASLASGIDLIKEMAQFDEAIQGSDWIITGEGQLDKQTLSGKTIAGVLQAAKNYQIPVAAFCGSVSVSIEDLETMGLDYVTSIINQPGTLQEVKDKSFENLVLTAYNFAKVLRVKENNSIKG